jgi:hypothetical protein
MAKSKKVVQAVKVKNKSNTLKRAKIEVENRRVLASLHKDK